MIDVNAAMNTEIAARVQTLARCWRLVASNGTVLRFTQHQLDLVVGGELYEAAGFAGGAIQQSVGLAADQHEVTALFNSEQISDADLLAGMLDGATYETFDCNYRDPDAGQIPVDVGDVGEIAITQNQWTLELLSITNRLDQEIGARYGVVCRNTLGLDDGVSICPVMLADGWTEAFTVDAVADRRAFAATALVFADGWFDGGRLTWLTGLNAGLSEQVKRSLLSGDIALRKPMPYAIQAGDTGTVHAGCNHLLKMPDDVSGQPYSGDCRVKFGAVAAFQGEPEILQAAEVAAS